MRRVRRSSLSWALALTGILVWGGALAGGGALAAPPRARTPLPAGLAIVVPADWHVALRLTGLAEPYERFTLASFALHRPPAARSECGPTQAVRTMPADGALAFVFEYSPAAAAGQRFPPQPRRFTLPAGPAEPYECFGSGWLLHFRVGARYFQIMIALGPRAGPNRVRLLAALSSLRVAAASGSS